MELEKMDRTEEAAHQQMAQEVAQEEVDIMEAAAVAPLQVVIAADVAVEVEIAILQELTPLSYMLRGKHPAILLILIYVQAAP
jgi:uncharacterized protein YueI